MNGKPGKIRTKLAELREFINDRRYMLLPAFFGAVSGMLFFGVLFGLYAVQIPDEEDYVFEEQNISSEEFPQVAVKSGGEDKTVVIDVVEDKKVDDVKNRQSAVERYAQDARNAGVTVTGTDAGTDVPGAETKITHVGRANPFAPSTSVDVTKLPTLSEDLMKGINFELVDPPSTVTDLPDVQNMMTTRVSGILYDRNRPSAVVNVNGTDILVRVGDKVQNYTIVGIYPDKVAVRSGANIYKASVGESLGAMNRPTPTVTSNIEHKFAGAYR